MMPLGPDGGQRLGVVLVRLLLPVVDQDAVQADGPDRRPRVLLLLVLGQLLTCSSAGSRLRVATDGRPRLLDQPAPALVGFGAVVELLSAGPLWGLADAVAATTWGGRFPLERGTVPGTVRGRLRRPL